MGFRSFILKFLVNECDSVYITSIIQARVPRVFHSFSFLFFPLRFFWVFFVFNFNSLSLFLSFSVSVTLSGLLLCFNLRRTRFSEHEERITFLPFFFTLSSLAFCLCSSFSPTSSNPIQTHSKKTELKTEIYLALPTNYFHFSLSLEKNPNPTFSVLFPASFLLKKPNPIKKKIYKYIDLRLSILWCFSV